VAKFFFGQSIGIDGNNTFQFYSSIKTVGATVLGVCGRWSGRVTLLKQTCAAQESQESACLIPVL